MQMSTFSSVLINRFHCIFAALVPLLFVAKLDLYCLYKFIIFIFLYVASKCQAMEDMAASVCNLLSSELKRIVSLSSEKGALSWLCALPVQEHGFALHKGAFWGCSLLALWVSPTWVTH